MAPLLRFDTAERGFARNVVERHPPQAGLFGNAPVESEAIRFASAPVLLEKRDTIYSPSGEPVASTPRLDISTKALAGIIVFLGIVVLAIAGLRLRKVLRNRSSKRKRSPHLRSLSLCDSPFPEKITSEKRNPMMTQILIDFGYDSLQPPSKAWTQHKKSDSVYSSDSNAQYAGWVPQIRSQPADSTSPDLIPRPFVMLAPPAPAAKRATRFSRLTTMFSRSPKPSQASFEVASASSPVPTPRSMTSTIASNHSNPFEFDDVFSKEAPSLDTKAKPSQKALHAKERKPSSLAPIRAEVREKVLPPRVPVPRFEEPAPVPVVTVADVTQTLLVSSKSDVPEAESALKSPSRLDSAGLEGPFASIHASQVPQETKLSRRESRIFASSADNCISSTQLSEGNVSASGKKLPRLVIIGHAFTPSMQDELNVRIGEVLRLTHEFRDGWCAVERIGQGAEQGVVPHFCITERASFVPEHAKTLSGGRLTFTASTTNSLSTMA